MAQRSSRVRAAAVVTLTLGLGCAPGRDAIAISEGTLVLENQSSREWRNVTITVNDHYRGGAAALRPGGRLTAPLRDFQSGFGHHFDRSRMNVYRVRVTATDADGRPVELAWGRPEGEPR